MRLIYRFIGSNFKLMENSHANSIIDDANAAVWSYPNGKKGIGLNVDKISLNVDSIWFEPCICQ